MKEGLITSSNSTNQLSVELITNADYFFVKNADEYFDFFSMMVILKNVDLF